MSFIAIPAVFTHTYAQTGADFTARPQIGGPFRLTSHRGETVSEKDISGHPHVIFFGFTQCPEVCPTTLWELNSDLNYLGERAKDLRIYFVSVDPERDTPEALANYLGSFDESISGLTGTPDEILQMARNYKVVYRKVPTTDDDYTMEHTALLYLMDADGKLFDTVRYQEDAQSRRKKLSDLLSKSASAVH